MEYRDFGRTGMKVSALGVGCWEIGGGYGDVTERDFQVAVHRAIDLGVNCFDTAVAYGKGESERILGRALGGKRKDALVVTKCGVGYRDRPKGRDSRRESILASIDGSLQNLGTDCVDVLLIHWPDPSTPMPDAMEAMDEVVQQGKARFVGVSNFTLGQLRECMSARRVDVVQYGLHMFDRRMEKDLFPYCEDNGIGVMTYGSLAFGMLAGAFTKETRFGENDWRANENMLPALFLKLFAEDNFAKAVDVVDDLAPIAEGLGKRLPHVALQWVLSNPAVSVALVGTRKAAEVEDNVGALGFDLAPDVVAAMDAVFDKHGFDTSPRFWIDPE